MKIVNPSSAATALRELLATGQFVMADLYTFSLPSGTMLRYTSADKAIAINGQTFSVNGPLIKRGSTQTCVGLDVDALDLEVYPDETHLIDGVSFTRAALTGALDGAELTLERAFGPDWQQPMLATVTLFSGRISSPEYDNGLTMEVKSHTELLDTAIPRHVYQPACMNTLYDAGCGVKRAERTQNGTVTGGTASSILTTLSSYPEGYFALGVLTFTSGVNSGIIRAVKWDVGGQFDFSLPLPLAPAPGDTFSVVPGCDRSQSTCQSKFNNLIRFSGQPYIPSPETSAPD